MTVFWAVLAVLALAVLCLAACIVRVGVLAFTRDQVWHPGDELPDIPQDAAIRRGFGG